MGEFYYRHIHPLITPYTFVLGTTAQTSSGKYLSIYITQLCKAERDVHPLLLMLRVTVLFEIQSLLDAHRDGGALHRRLPSAARTFLVHLQTRPNGCRHYRNLFPFLQFASFLRSRTLFVRRQRTGWIVDNGTYIRFSLIYLHKNTTTGNWLNQCDLCIQLIPSPLRNDKTYVTWYIVSLYFIIMNFVPFTLLAILNGAIYKQVSSFQMFKVYFNVSTFFTAS